MYLVIISFLLFPTYNMIILNILDINILAIKFILTIPIEILLLYQSLVTLFYFDKQMVYSV